MLDENIWTTLSEEEKMEELCGYLSELVNIEKGTHELSNTPQKGRLAKIKKDLHEKICKIIELENAS